MAKLDIPLGEQDQEHRSALFMELIDRFVAVASRHKIRYFLDFGTLLGLYRDGQLIANDSDVDIGIFIEELTWDFLTDLGEITSPATLLYRDQVFARGADTYYPLPWFGLRLFDEQGSEVRDRGGNSIAGDIYIYSPLRFYDEDYYLYRVSSSIIITPALFFTEFDLLNVQGKSYSIPGDTDHYLQYRYGAGWKVPSEGDGFELPSPLPPEESYCYSVQERMYKLVKHEQ